MRILWKISRKDITQAKAFYDGQKSCCFVQDRIRCIQKRAAVSVSKPQFWKAMILCLLTTQQRSGPNSPVGRFVALRPFPLPLSECAAHDNLEKHVSSVIKAHGGIRRAPTIARQLSDNYSKMKIGLWPDTRAMLEHVRKSGRAAVEREVANFIQDHYKGFGPKQSRNLLQSLGLSRHEIPIDSRITKWLNEFGFPIKLTASGLSDRNYYQFVSDGFQKLCTSCDILPCLMDAAIFSSYDGDGWTKENLFR